MGIFDFGMQRNWWQAILYYLYFLIAIFIIGATGSMLYAVTMGPDLHGAGFEAGWQAGKELGHQFGRTYGPFMNVFLSLCLSLLSLNAKKSFTPTFVILSLFGVLLSVLTGALGGLIVPAYLTTIPNKNNTGTN